MAQLDMSKLVPEEAILGDDEEETALLQELFRKAQKYASSLQWHRGITRSYFGLGVGGIVCVALFEVVPAGGKTPDTTWVVVGDLPPAYIAVDDAPNPAAALDAYIGAMEDWVDAARAGRSVAGLIPVNVEPTGPNAERLAKRLQFLDREILSNYEEDLRG